MLRAGFKQSVSKPGLLTLWLYQLDLSWLVTVYKSKFETFSTICWRRVSDSLRAVLTLLKCYLSSSFTPFLLFYSLFSECNGKSKSLSPGFLCNYPDNGLPQRAFYTKLKDRKWILLRIPRQSHPNFRKPLQWDRCSSLLIPVYWLREEKDSKSSQDMGDPDHYPKEVWFLLVVLHNLC